MTSINTNNSEIRAVPTNIITGFLGVGKTSMILHLLKNKPADERWAILVNEFGEIGVDGSLLEGQQPQESGVYIREVPGGCMCCAAGVPMQIALNQLLKSATPDRLLIEPTGLGHPKEILEVLSSEHYQQVLSLQKTITLVDARKLSDQRYTSHDIFNQQIAIADTVVGNKSDLYSEGEGGDNGDKQKLIDYVKQKGTEHAQVIFAQHGDIELAALAGPSLSKLKIDEDHHHHHGHNDRPLLPETPIPECGFIKAVNQGEGFHSIGWRFSGETIFDHNKLVEFVWSCTAERVKAVFITDKGFYSFNLDTDALTEVELPACDESRIEIISERLNDNLEEALMSCILA
ncbi:GTP-binding protein [uncultured Cocleimonas sp.]|uniref:CobW family GTP-binding protein n=1 Tax=uncultured Cocleimonas sp. TaxID=1051587 RepID=UPI00260C2024|nr:GTP-binding protein [uncultured Cocleimonas sp.]